MYKLIKSPLNQDLILRVADNAFIPVNPDNTDYQAYLKFLADGGQPLPADEQGVA